MKSLKTVCISCLFFCCLSYCSVGSAYQITEQELSRLETNLNRLAEINRRSQKNLAELEVKLKKSQETSNQLEKRLLTLQRTSETQEQLLLSANQSLEMLEQENKKKLRKAKMQRTIWQVIAIGVLAFAIERGTK